MAIHAPITGAPPRAIQLPPILAFIMGLPVAPREAVERTIQAAIDALDQLDGDPDDQQANGDELDGDGSEDDFMHHGSDWRGEPGCPISDPPSIAWIEWHQRGRHKLDHFGAERQARDRHDNPVHEDHEVGA